ncbi:MAG: ribosomal protein S18-alanine N-acetyltransferase [Desulfobulbaceae bacterium]|uniref:[Ribosomal protein bS18]-alanine N-acetyltransferase n=1 Tax=Candidatus Desulfobia pelagia TaxID=2841692 RepID=A0A8J6NGA9_9BACT|nr:ribosomal protein S18-alanine N-acetyltransferase [Candidatus Desulfobia pelagia]
MIPGLVIRPMSGADIPEILALETESPAWSGSQFAGEMSQTIGWQYVAASSALLGYICGRSVLDEAEIVKIAVKRDARRTGVATRLLVYSLEKVFQKGVRTCYLEVRSSNTAARSFYEKNDFVVTGVRKNYYVSPREDAVMMAKALG